MAALELLATPCCNAKGSLSSPRDSCQPLGTSALRPRDRNPQRTPWLASKQAADGGAQPQASELQVGARNQGRRPPNKLCCLPAQHQGRGTQLRKKPTSGGGALTGDGVQPDCPGLVQRGRQEETAKEAAHLQHHGQHGHCSRGGRGRGGGRAVPLKGRGGRRLVRRGQSKQCCWPSVFSGSYSVVHPLS